MTENQDKKIRIVWTSEHNCIRVVKQVRALVKTGKYDIHGLAKQVSYGTQDFDKFSFYHNQKQFKNLIRDLDADLYVHSNEPNIQLNWIREVQPDAKIILDAHDLDSVRLGILPIEEHQAITNCDGILFVSKEVQAFILNLHRDQMRDKPTAVLEHYCNEEFLTDSCNPSPEKRKGIVYQGGAQSPPYKNSQYKYRQLYPIFRQLIDQGHEFHLMAGNPDVMATYANIGAFIYEPQVYTSLMKKLQNHRWGVIVWNNADLSQAQVNLTRTNKEQEYMACGLPLIVFGAPATAEYVKEHGVGLVFDKLEDITPEALDKAYAECKANVDKLRPSLSMEAHIHRMEDLIKQVLEK